MKLYLDENLSPRVAELLRIRGVDAVSAHEAGFTQADDRSQFRRAVQQGRAIVTCDVRDFVHLATAAVAANLDHPGMILIPSSLGTEEFAAIAEAVEAVVRRHPEGLPGTVVYAVRVS